MTATVMSCVGGCSVGLDGDGVLGGGVVEPAVAGSGEQPCPTLLANFPSNFERRSARGRHR